MRTSADLSPSSDAVAVPLIASGTTTSSRGRGVEVGWNSLVVLQFEDEIIRVTPHRLNPDGGDFEPLESVRFPNASGESDEVDDVSGSRASGQRVG